MDIVEEAVNSKLRSHLCNVVSMVCTVQILQIYLHDLSVVRLIFSLVLQYSVLSPQFEQIRANAPPPNRRTVMLLIAANQLFAVVSHIFRALPVPRFDGRFHGLIFVEFIGVRPVARFWLVIWDLVVLVLQFLEFSTNFPTPTREVDSPEAQDLPDPQLEEPTETPHSETTALLQHTAVSVAKVLSGTAVIYSWDIPRNIAYNWRYSAPHVVSESDDSSSESESNVGTLESSILPTAVPLPV